MTTLITGGAGFLGRGWLSHDSETTTDTVIYSRDETKQDICRVRYPSNTHFVLGDITDWDNLYSTLLAYDVDTVIHAAAIKYIPEAEFNVRETLRVNVEGSKCVFDACGAAGVSKVIAISTDKACQPVNVYGMTKLIMERLLSEYAWIYKHTTYAGVRYGNVVGSTGSVIPMFKRQFKEQGYVTITDPHMTRYWISIKDAVGLIKTALTECTSGQLVIPKPAAMTLMDVALAVTGGEGGRVNTDKVIKIIGERPGEKRHEHLLHQQEGVRAQDVGLHYILNPVGTDPLNEGITLVSSNPTYWLTRKQLLQYVEEAELV